MFARTVQNLPKNLSRQQKFLHTEQHLKTKNITLPTYQGAVHNYVKAQRDGNTLYIGDHVGQDLNQQTVRGKVGTSPQAEVTPEQAYDLARNAGLRLLSTLSHYCDGDLDRVEQVIKLTGIVNAEPDFKGHGKVINGCSDILVEALGDRGRHARTCTGSGSLPAAVTCEMQVKLKDSLTSTTSTTTSMTGERKSEVDIFLGDRKVSDVSTHPIYKDLFQNNQAWMDIMGVTYGALTSTHSGSDLFTFNKTFGSTALNYIPDGPVQAHFNDIATGKTIVWGAFVEENGISI